MQCPLRVVFAWLLIGKLNSKPGSGMTSRAFRSSAIGVTYIARQFGIQVNADAVEEAIQRGTLTKPKDFYRSYGPNCSAGKARPFGVL